MSGARKLLAVLCAAIALAGCTQGWSRPVGPGPGEPGGPVPAAIPTPPVKPTCIGVPAIWCERSVEDAMSNLNGADPASIIRVVIRCTGTCTNTRGDGDAVITLADGTRLESQWSYRSE